MRASGAPSLLFPALGGAGSAGALGAGETSVPGLTDEGDGTKVGDLAVMLSILSSLVLIFRR